MAAEDSKGSQYCQAGIILFLVIAAIFGFLANEFIPKETLESTLNIELPASISGGKTESPRRQQLPSQPERLSTLQDCERILNEALREYSERHLEELDPQSEDEHQGGHVLSRNAREASFSRDSGYHEADYHLPHPYSETIHDESDEGGYVLLNTHDEVEQEPDPEAGGASSSSVQEEDSPGDTSKDDAQALHPQDDHPQPIVEEHKTNEATQQHTPKVETPEENTQSVPRNPPVDPPVNAESDEHENDNAGDSVQNAPESDDDEDDDDDDDRPDHVHHDDDSDEEPDTESDSGGAHVVQELPIREPLPDKPKTKEEEKDNKAEAMVVELKDDQEVEDEISEEPQTEEADTEGEEEEPEDKATANHQQPTHRSRSHIAQILGYKDIGTQQDKEEDVLIQDILQELKKISVATIQPMEKLYKFKDISQRVLGDAEIFNKPMALFLGPWSAGKSSIINYLLGIEGSPVALKTGPHPTDTDFSIIHYTNSPQRISGTEMAAHWAFSSVNKFGQGFLDHFRGIGYRHPLLQKVTIVDTPGILEHRRPTDYPFNDAFQWFIDRADAIYVVFDPSKLEIGSELEAILDQLKGREPQIRFILNKADTIQRSDIMRVTGQLLWNVSPLLGSAEAPVIYSVSLTSRPFHPLAPEDYLEDQEAAFLADLRQVMDERIENTIAFARRHAVRVRNHAKLVDCYLATYYKQKSIFSAKKKVADQIIQDPHKYNIFEGLSKLSNISRYDLPDPQAYYKFFRLNPLYEFKPLQATCTYFKGCPLDKLDIAIAYDLPELLGKYNERTKKERYQEDKGR